MKFLIVTVLAMSFNAFANPRINIQQEEVKEPGKVVITKSFMGGWDYHMG